MIPLVLEPLYESPVWSRNRLAEKRGLPQRGVGCSWEVSSHPHGSNRILNGPLQGKTLSEVIEACPEMLGKAGKTDLLRCAISDAGQVLSIQNHPDDAYALAHENDLGKTESWYVLEADPGAWLYAGTKAQSKEQVRSAAQDGTLCKDLIQIPVKAGDFIQIQSGQLHALGAGITILEIANNSNVTYRLYDHGRKGRALHLEKGLDILNPEARSLPRQTPETEDTELVNTGRYTIHVHDINGERTFFLPDRFSTLHAIDFEGELVCEGESIPITAWQSLFVPADAGGITLKGTGRIVRAWPILEAER